MVGGCIQPKGPGRRGRQPAIPSGCRSALGMEPRWQPKIGGLALQAAVDSGSSGRSRSSREQAPAYYTSMRHSANRREHCTGTKGPHAHRLQGGQLTHWHEAPRRRQGFEVRCKRQPKGQAAGGRQAPGMSGLLPARSSQ